MQSPGHLISLVASVPLVLVGLATQTFASSQSNRNSNSPQYVELAPEPQSNERVKSYPNHKLASCELYRQGVGYNAYGIEGQRLCYGKTEGMTNFVLAENEPEADGSYVGNDSMSSINIGKFLCSKGIETDGKKLELNCLDKRPVYAETKIEKVEALDAGKYNVTFSYEGCIDDKVRVQQVCFELYPDQSPDTASLYASIDIQVAGSCARAITKSEVIEISKFSEECLAMNFKYLEVGGKIGKSIQVPIR